MPNAAPAPAPAATPLIPSPLQGWPTVLVLASGRGERFRASGGSTHKLHALLGDKTVLQHTLDVVRASGLPWHLEDAGHPGMGDSIAAAVQRTPGATGWLILPADLPLLHPATLQAVARALQAPGVPAAVPRCGGQRGHPVGFSAACGPALAALSGEAGAAPVLRPYLASGAVVWVDVDDEGILTDIDTVQDLARARQRLGLTPG